jgi:uncharacterized membrane protein
MWGFILGFLALIYASNLSRRVEKLEQKATWGKVEPSSPLPSQASPSVSQAQAELATPPKPLPAPEDSSSLLHQNITPVKFVGAVGVIALVLGIGFFFKYAIDQGWINELGRVVLGVIAGGLILGLSTLWKNKYSNIAQVLAAGSVAIWYFTTFASHSFYHQISVEVAFAILIAITIVSVLLAYSYNSKALGILALVGAYLVPGMVDFGDSQYKVLFIYLILVNAGSLAVMARRYWIEIAAVAVLANFIHFLTWLNISASQSNSIFGIIYVLVNLLVVVLVLGLAFREAATKEPSRVQELGLPTSILLGVTAVMSFVGLTALSREYGHRDLLPLLLVLGALTIFIAYTLVDRLEAKPVNWVMIWAGKLYLVAAIFWQFQKPLPVLYLLLLAALGLLVGFMARRYEVRASAAALLVFSAVVAVVYGFLASSGSFLASAEFWLVVLAVLALAGGTWVYKKYEGVLVEGEKQAEDLFPMLALAAFWLQSSVEIGRNLSGFNGNAINLLMSLWWMALGVLAALVGIWPKLKILRVGSASLISLAVLKVFLYDVQALEMGYRVVSFIVLGVILLSLAFAYEKNKTKLKDYFSTGNDKFSA